LAGWPPKREIVLAEYEDKIGTLVNGVISRVEGRLVRVELGRAQGIMPVGEQIQGERYYPGQRLKFFLKDVEKGFRGPQLIVSRGSREFVEQLFRGEVPEMENNSVEIKEIAREAGIRSKIAVASNVPGVDPVGTLTGYELDVEAEKTAEEKAAEKDNVPEGVESKPVVQKLKKKSELESSLLEAIEEHGTETKK
jgi:hypothetical protein